MASIILSVKKIYSDLIFSGIKTIEYRRTLPRSIVDRILIYESSGLGKIIGEVSVESIISDSPENVWELTYADGGINKEVFYNYFNKTKYAHAYKLRGAKRYEKPKSISDFGLKRAPQNFSYIKELL